MHLTILFTLFALICSVLALPHSPPAVPSVSLPKRDPEPIPIPTLFPQAPRQPQDHHQLLPRDDTTTFGTVWMGDDKGNKSFELTQNTHDKLWCNDFRTQKNGKVLAYTVVFEAICYFYEKDCDPGKGQADAPIGWENSNKPEEATTVDHDWKINTYACLWANQTTNETLIGDPKAAFKKREPVVLEG